MIDIGIVRGDAERVRHTIREKFQDDKLELVDDVLALDEKWRYQKKKSDTLRSKRNQLSKQINELMKKGKKKDASLLIKDAQNIPSQINAVEKRMDVLRKKVDVIMMRLPNFLDENVPKGKSEKNNVVRETYGKPVVPRYDILNHAELAMHLEGLDVEHSRVVSGQGFYYLKGPLAQLHSALLTYARDFMIKKGFEYVIPPFMIRSDVVKGVMSFEEMDAMMYKVEEEDLYLVGTSEHSVLGMFKDRVLTKRQVPSCITSYSPCFRKEKGAHGIEERGLYRVHQFEKQEMVVVCEPKESSEWYEKMISITVDFFKSLGIPIRTLECCSGDLGDLKARSCDVEAWSPRQKEYYEVGSCSNLTDAQARRLGIRINGGQGNYFAHTLNNTVVASPRALIAILENHQLKDGSVTVPLVLRPYMGDLVKIELKKTKS